MSTMDESEAHAQKFLLHLGLGPVRYEPDGNQPPDFLTADEIAVEGRRLNQHFDDGGKPVALEYDPFPFLTGMRRLLSSFGPSRDGRSWWVAYHFHRPVPVWKELEPAVKAAAAAIDASGIAPTSILQVHAHFELHVLPCSSPQSDRFLLSGFGDYNAGGWLMHELQRNVQICADEKRRKVAPFRQRYERWWLVLVDRIGLGSSALERELASGQVHVEHDWDRLVLLNPRDSTKWIDVQSDSAAA